MNPFAIFFLNLFHSTDTQALDEFFRIITQFGSEAFFIIVIPPIYWCVNKKFGYRLLIITTLAAYISTVLKNIVGMERPPEHLRKTTAYSYAFPSGHAHGSTTFWGYIIIRTKQEFFLILGTIIVVLVAYSRVYLGVHYPGDVYGGVALGIATIVFFLYLEPKLTRLTNAWDYKQKLIVGMFIPLLLFVYVAIFYNHDPRGVKLSGALMGMVSGYVLENEFIKFEINVPFRVKILRIIIGLAIAYTAYFGLNNVVPVSIISCFALAWLGGFTVTFIAPWLFTRLEDN
ncbi:phosphatase PAP2 family protein [[Eubacterium] cellulosolvens]